MKHFRVYLAGPISNVDAHDAGFWRIQTAKLLETHGHFAVDPFRRNYQNVSRIGKVMAATIIHEDLQDMKGSDLMIRWFDMHAASEGSAQEMFYFAHVLNRPVIACVPYTDVRHSPWLVAHADAIVGTLIQAVNEVNRRAEL